MSFPVAPLLRKAARSVPGGIAILALLLAACWATTWLLGGAGMVAPHWFYIPILYAASRFGTGWAVGSAVVSGIVAGPLTPVDVSQGVPQATSDWLSRAISFVVIGFLLSQVLERRKRAERAREEHEAELETLRAIDLSILGVAPFEQTLGIARRALDRLVWLDRLGLVLRDRSLDRIRRFWVGRNGIPHHAEEGEPRSGPLAEALRRTEPLSGRVDPAGSAWEVELAAEGLRSFLLLPLAAQGEVLGVLAVSSSREDPFPPSEIATCTRIATQLAVALRAGQLHSDLERRVAELDAIRKVSEAAGASLDLTETIEAALGRSLEVAGFDLGWVSLLDEDSNELGIVAERNLSEVLRGAAERSGLDGSLLGQVMADGRPRFLRDAPMGPPSSEAGSPRGEATASIVAVPLHWKGSVIGIMVLGTLDAGVPAVDDFNLVVALGRPIAAALGNARLYERTRKLEEQRSRLVTQIVNAQEEERRRVAVDLHDDAVQVMAAVGIRLDILRGAAASDPDQLDAIDKCSLSTREAVTRMRHMLFELHPPSLEREGLSATLRLSIRDLEEDSGIKAVIEGELKEEPPPEARVVLYRIAREALTNVRKHSRATRVGVRLQRRDGGFFIQVVDNGKGLDHGAPASDRPGHLGLVAMRERAELAGGWCKVRADDGAGTTVEAWIPGEHESEETSGAHGIDELADSA